MPREKSAGAVIFRMERGQPLYLLLHYPGAGKYQKGYWDFPKGHVEQGEKEWEAAKRELREETGIRDASFLKGFREVITYFFKKKGKGVFKVVVFYLAKTRHSKIKVSFEHTGYQWATFQDAMGQLKFRNAKQILTKAHEFLCSKQSSHSLPPRRGAEGWKASKLLCLRTPRRA